MINPDCYWERELPARMALSGWHPIPLKTFYFTWMKLSLKLNLGLSIFFSFGGVKHTDLLHVTYRV